MQQPACSLGRSVSRPRLAAAVLFAALALPACGGGSPSEESRRSEPPSIVVVLIDTLRADHLGCYGYDRPTSPRIDAFARGGVVFEHALAQSTWTKPATGSIHTGLYPSRHGATTPFTALRSEQETLAELLKAQGYRTAGMGSNPHIFGGTGFDQGFDQFEEVPFENEPVGHARAEAIVDRALAWLANARGRGPFFLYVHLFDPHAPYDPPEPYRSQLDRGARGEHDAWYMVQNGVFATDLSPQDWEHYRDLYDGEIAYSDAQVGRLLDSLDLEHTAVFVLADHGEELFDHGGWSHTPTMYEELVHVPLIASFPGATDLAGARIPGLVQQVDVFPTVLDLLGLPQRPALPGRSLLATARGTAPAASEGFSEVDEFGQFKKAVVAGGLKYIHAWSPQAREQLYDLDRDRGELQDVLADEPEQGARLRALLDEHVRGAPARYAFAVRNDSAETVTLGGFVAGEHGRVEGSDLIDCEFDFDGAPDFDGPFLFVDGRIGERAVETVQFTLRTRPGDLDGFYFTPKAGETRIELYLNLGQGPPDPKLIHIGPAGGHPDSANPLVLDLAEPERYSSPSRPSGDGDYGIYVWRTLDAPGASIELDAERRAALERLGYTGDQ